MTEEMVITLRALKSMSRDELMAIILEQMAVDNDNSIQHDLLFDLVRKYVDTNEELKRTLIEVERLSNTDPLTGLNNRLYFSRIFDREFHRFQRYEQTFCLILMDIDHFKNVNDTYGHNIGDEVLVAVSGILREKVREVDIIARWGGEEFIILTTASNSMGTEILAERIRIAIESHGFPEVGQVTMSMGISEVRPGDNLSSITARADGALYKAKEGGRNRVVIA